MKIKDKIKSYSFWVSLASAVILILKVAGSRFGFTVDESMVSDAFTAICSILVLLGIIVVPTNQQDKTTSTKSTTNNNCNEITTNTNPETSSNENFTEHNDFENLIINKSSDVQKDDIEPIKSFEINEVIKSNLTDDNNIIKTNNITEVNNLNKADTTETNPIIENNSINQTTTCNEKVSDDMQTMNTDSEIQETTTEGLNAIENSNTTKGLNAIENSNTIESLNTIENSNTIEELKELFNKQREKFANNINDYILELQEELRKTREGM